MAEDNEALDSDNSLLDPSQPSAYKVRPHRLIPRGNDPQRSQKSVATNDIFALIHCPLIGQEARRWRDLVLYYYEKLGERMFDEVIRLKVIMIVNLTLEIERQTDGVVSGKKGRLVSASGPPHKRVFIYRQGDPESMITQINTISSLLKQIGLE